MFSARTAGNILLVGYGLLVFFHVLVLTRIVPSSMVWGGQVAASPANLRTLETVSLIVTVLFAIVVAARIDYIKAAGLKNVIRILLWIIFAYTLLNAVGNLASGFSLESLIFTPIALVMAFFILRLALGD